jgi:hypothetical protein
MDEIADREVTFCGPESVVALFRAALSGFGAPGEPCWKALERLLLHVIREWESQPQHRDPIFARDGWRCTVPGCGSRKNLHDHHRQFRSRGGTNDRSNRTSNCAWHHLRGIHAGLVRVSGKAPDDLVWELGLAPGRAALLLFRGDRYLRGL